METPIKDVKILVSKPHAACKGFGCRFCNQRGREAAEISLVDLVKIVKAALQDGDHALHRPASIIDAGPAK